MKTKRRVKVPPKHRDARSLADLSDLLFPHSPITAAYDFTYEGSDKVYEWHIYVEGQWFDKEPSLLGLATRLYEIIESQGDDWSSPSLRVEPGWGGWHDISAVSLAQMSVMCDELRSDNAQYYRDE